MPNFSPVPGSGEPTPAVARPLRRRISVATAAAALAAAVIVVTASAGPGLGLTEVPAQPRTAGVAAPNYLSPELIETVIAQGSWVIENPSGVVSYYGYLNDGGPLVPTSTANFTSAPGPLEAQKTEPDKNTYVVLKGQHGPSAQYSYGEHFLFQGHELGAQGSITRLNLDADPTHRVTLLATTQAGGAANTGINLPAGTNLPVIDGSAWNPFTRTLLFSAEGNGTSTGGIWEAGPDYPSTVVDRLGLFGRGGYEGIQLDSDGNIWFVEDIGGKTGSASPANSGLTNSAKQPNSFLYRFVPYQAGNLNAGGKLQVLQADGKNHLPVTFHGGSAPTQTDIDTDIQQPFMSDLHAYGNSFATRWITIHDTAVDGTATFNANLLAKTAGGTPFKRPENGQFRPGTKFTDFFFTETGDTNQNSGANATLGGWGAILRLTQSSPSATTGTLSAFFIGDVNHTGLDNITFLDKDNVIAVEDAGDTLHGQRNALDSGYIFPVRGSAAPTPFRFLGEGRDASATIDAANGGFKANPADSFGKNEGDNEITGAHISDGDPTIKGLIGTKEPKFLGRTSDGRGDNSWRFFWTQQHGDNATYEILNATR